MVVRMELIFRGKHLVLAEDFRSYASKRLGRLARYLPTVDHAIVDVRREGDPSSGRFVVQVTVDANGTFLRAEERSRELEEAMDAVARVLSRQVQRFKARVYRSQQRLRKTSVAAESEEPALPLDTEIVSNRVVKIKRFVLKPMTGAEALEQMELLGHNFFLFRDGDKGGYALLYRRRDGDYGMIIPEAT